MAKPTRRKAAAAKVAAAQGKAKPDPLGFQRSLTRLQARTLLNTRGKLAVEASRFNLSLGLAETLAGNVARSGRRR